jgi:anaerobic magnesium-protoporphyrin IX monomethyl ester cyclase
VARITLVNPQITVTSWNPPLGSLDTTCIRLGLAYLSASLKNEGHKVELIDLRLLKGWKDYDTLLKKQRPEFLGVTMHTSEFDTAVECCRRAKTFDSSITTITGGIHPTMFPSQILKTGVVDYVLRGEGEISFPKFIKNPKNFAPSFWGETPDLNLLPLPDRDLWSDYAKRVQFPLFPTFSPPSIDILTKRGCPWQCGFCCGPGEQNLYTTESSKGARIPSIRQRNVPNVMKELTSLYNRYKFKSIVFHDDQFVIQPKWVEEFCQSMHNYGFVENGVNWWAASRADIIVKYPELFKQMKEAGLTILSVGFESFSNEMLRWINKGITAEQSWEAVTILRKLGIQIYGNFIFGIPYSDGKWYPAYDVELAKAISQIKPEIISTSFFTPMPGSTLYEFCVKNDLILSSTSKKLGLRLSNEGKIKGVDYKFLNKLLSSFLPKQPFFVRPAKTLQKTRFYTMILLSCYHKLQPYLNRKRGS